MTADGMRIIDWSSDVCSSDLDTVDTASRDERNAGDDVSRALNGNSTLVSLARADGITRALVYPSPSRHAPFSGEPAFARLRDGEIGRASCRERVGQCGLI